MDGLKNSADNASVPTWPKGEGQFEISHAAKKSPLRLHEKLSTAGR
jgi:hypothetical protein